MQRAAELLYAPKNYARRKSSCFNMSWAGGVCEIIRVHLGVILYILIPTKAGWFLLVCYYLDMVWEPPLTRHRMVHSTFNRITPLAPFHSKIFHYTSRFNKTFI